MAAVTPLSWLSHTVEQDNSSVTVTVVQFYTPRGILYDRLIAGWLPSTLVEQQVLTLGLGAATRNSSDPEYLNVTQLISLHKQQNISACQNLKHYCL